MDFNRVFSLIPFHLLRSLYAAVGTSFTTEFFRITVEDLFIFSCKRYTKAEFLMIHIVKITYAKKRFFFTSAHKHDHAFLMVTAVDPFKTFCIKILLIQCRMCLIQLVQLTDISLHVLMQRIF